MQPAQTMHLSYIGRHAYHLVELDVVIADMGLVVAKQTPVVAEQQKSHTAPPL